MLQEFSYFHMYLQLGIRHIQKQTDRHDTFYTPVWGLVSLTPINNMVQSAVWVVMAQVQLCHAKVHSLVIALLLLACKISPGVNVIGASHMYHIY